MGGRVFSNQCSVFSGGGLDGALSGFDKGVFSDCAGAGPMPFRHSRKPGRAASARRTFSSHERFSRERCHAACRAKSCCTSVMRLDSRIEPHAKAAKGAKGKAGGGLGREAAEQRQKVAHGVSRG